MQKRRIKMHKIKASPFLVLILIWALFGTTFAFNSTVSETSTIKNALAETTSEKGSVNSSDEIKDGVDNAKTNGDLINPKDGCKLNHNANSTDSCAKLKERYIKDNPFERHLRIFGAQRNLSVLWGAHAPARAAAAMLVAALRQRHRFEQVKMRAGPHGLCELATEYKAFHGDDKKYNELVVHVAVEMTEPKDCPALRDCSDLRSVCTAAGPRLQFVDVASLPMDVWLQAHMATPIDPACSTIAPFLDDVTLSKCGFLRPLPAYLREKISISREECVPESPCIPVLVPADVATAGELFAHVMAARPQFRLVFVTRDVLHHALCDHSMTFLYLDYQLYASEPWHINILRSDTNVTYLSSSPALRFADTALLRQFAPRIFSTVKNFAPDPTDLRDVLNREAGGLPVEEAACAWALENRSRFESWANAAGEPLWAMVFFCREDPDIDALRMTAREIGRYIEDKIDEFQFIINQSVVHCGNATALPRELEQITRDMRWQRMVGAAAAGAGASAAAAFADRMQTQLALYDVTTEDTKLNAAASAVGAGARHLALALRRFLYHQGWRRLAVLSDRAPTAEEFLTVLQEDPTLVIRKEQPAVDEGFHSALERLRDAGARVFVINADARGAAAAMQAACALGMAGAEYAWLVREWREADFACAARIVSVSYWWRGGDDSVLVAGGEQLRKRLSSLWPHRAWPPHAQPLADALLLLARRLQAALKAQPLLRYDLHGRGSAQIITDHYKWSVPAEGVTQPLQLSDHSRAEPLVFLHEWKNTQAAPTLLAVWSVNASGDIIERKNLQNAYEGAPPHDGFSNCGIKQGDPFQPHCIDGLVAFLAVVLCITPIMLYLARRARLRRISEHLHAERVKWITRDPKTVAAVTDYLVDRSTIVLQDREALGTGHFGRVVLAVLRLPHRPPLLVAVKTPLENADAAGEAEFLHEASMLARLQHDHIVRLIGVCATEGPLLLMQHALFGDLLRYLRARSRLLPGDPELDYVTPTQLTRLAREAAEALMYLAQRHVVHRDVRAANCLVDGTRSLKLADFGMARDICKTQTTAEDDQYVYECQRRGMFPVPWMAPESVRYGVFSPATDVWALGVLALELATLGAKPFGAWPPDRVLSHVRMGRHAPLPLDASRETREVISMCWRLAKERATAADVRAYLMLHPTALEPAHVPGWVPGTDDHDSGFDERCHEPDWRIPANLSVSTL